MMQRLKLPMDLTVLALLTIRLKVSGLSVDLGPGTYWLSVAPIGSGNRFSFVQTTSFLNSSGGLWLGNAFIDSPTADFAADVDRGNGTPNYSMGVESDVSAGVPEPASLTLWGLGALGCAVAAYRRKRLPA